MANMNFVAIFDGSTGNTSGQRVLTVLRRSGQSLYTKPFT